jgi:hypothetical protein
MDRPVIEVLFPQVRARLFEVLFRRPIRQRYVRELMGVTGLALHTVQDELRKLSAIGIVRTWSNDYHRFYAANPSHPLFAHLVAFVQVSGRLPRAKDTALRRPRSQAKKRARGRPRHMPIDWQPRWGLFESPRKT